MKDIHIAGTGIWYPEDTISNDEIVLSFNSYVDNFNTNNKDRIDRGEIEKLEYSSTEFIEKASGIKTRHVIDKNNILNINKMMPSVVHEDESKMSIHAEVGIKAAQKAMDNAGVTPDDIDAVILGTSHAARNYPSVAIEIQNELGIDGYAYDMLVRENFIEAEKSFKAFIGEHPDDPLASNAYYWLGETYYVQKKFQLAAISFARGFQNFPKGNKAIDQLFKLALTFMNLGKNEDACAAFSKLESEFPKAPKRISNRAKEYIKRAKC